MKKVGECDHSEQEYEDDSWREEDWESTLHSLSNPTNRSEIASLENVTLLLDLGEESLDLQNTGEAEIETAGNCYESFDGVVDLGKAFCHRFPSSSSAKLLNMFSTVDHSGFCLAHLWTYRDLDVVGLADSPTEVSDMSCHLQMDLRAFQISNYGKFTGCSRTLWILCRV